MLPYLGQIISQERQGATADVSAAQARLFFGSGCAVIVDPEFPAEQAVTDCRNAAGASSFQSGHILDQTQLRVTTAIVKYTETSLTGSTY